MLYLKIPRCSPEIFYNKKYLNKLFTWLSIAFEANFLKQSIIITGL